ncbi:MAG: DEAD/DEAH box helicase, partial [Candidatus Binatia bacterium]|nr:DEAD/DEAH box helicase [Candidatus Binatia bacterium]
MKSVEDLLYHLPFRYEDRREILRIEEATVGFEGSFVGKLVALSRRSMRRRGGQILLGTLSDGTGNISLAWFHPKPFIAKRLQRGGDYFVHGKVEAGRGLEKKIVHPEFETIEPDDEEEREKVLPVYVRPGGIPLRSIRRWVKEALNSHCRFLPSFIPGPVARRHQLTDLGESLWEIHQPGGGSDILFLNQFRSPAHHSIIFDEFFYLQLGLALQRKHRTAQQGIAFHSRDNSLSRRMRSLLPFDLTRAQERVLGEIVTDMESPRPMQRLVQGDVGSGKTILAWFAALKAIEEGYQVVLMAPTELLAEQHFRSLKGFADTLGISIALLTGSLRANERRTLKDKLGSGEIVFVVGTHALIQEGVVIPRMGLGIV